jgi:hypothetical protein
MNLKKKIILLWVIFALLDPDPDSESGSGSTDPIESGSNPDMDPDPQPCVMARLFWLMPSSRPPFKKFCDNSVFQICIRIWIGSEFNQVSGSGSRSGIRIRIVNSDQDPEGQKLSTKILKNHEISCFAMLDVFF